MLRWSRGELFLLSSYQVINELCRLAQFGLGGVGVLSVSVALVLLRNGVHGAHVDPVVERVLSDSKSISFIYLFSKNLTSSTR